MEELVLENDYKKPNTGITIISWVSGITLILNLFSNTISCGLLWNCIGVGLLIAGLLKFIVIILNMDCPRHV